MHDRVTSLHDKHDLQLALDAFENDLLARTQSRIKSIVRSGLNCPEGDYLLRIRIAKFFNYGPIHQMPPVGVELGFVNLVEGFLAPSAHPGCDDYIVTLTAAGRSAADRILEKHQLNIYTLRESLFSGMQNDLSQGLDATDYQTNPESPNVWSRLKTFAGYISTFPSSERSRLFVSPT